MGYYALFERNPRIVPLSSPVCDSLVVEAKKGDAFLRQRLVTEWTSWLHKQARKCSHNGISDFDETYRLVLSAFHSAVDRYDPESGIPFEFYAAQIIRNHLTDWRRLHQTTPVENNQTQSNITQINAQTSDDPRQRLAYGDKNMQDSIIKIEYQLSLFNTSLAKLANHFPKKPDDMQKCIKLAKALGSSETLFNQSLLERKLPIQSLSEICNVPTVSIKRHRYCVLCLAILLSSNLLLIRSYVEIMERELS